MFPRSTQYTTQAAQICKGENERPRGHFSLFGMMSMSKNYNTEKVHTIDCTHFLKWLQKDLQSI